MSDDTAPAPESGKQTFQVVPTLDGYMELADRVAHLEANSPATDDTDDSDAGTVTEDDLDQVHGRLDRHRDEIEEIKKRYNALLKWFGAVSPQTPQAEAANTVTPTNRNMVQ